jgi:CheY-like chemotaxis protein
MARVLVIDDEPDIRDGIAEILSAAGYEVLTASDGLEALEKAHGRLAVALILLDLVMPRMNGWQFRAAQKLDPAIARVPVIVVSATPISGMDADRVIEKPFEVEALLAAVRGVVPASA